MFWIICQSTTDCRKHHTSSSARDYSHRLQSRGQISRIWLSMVNVCIMESVRGDACFLLTKSLRAITGLILWVGMSSILLYLTIGTHSVC